MGIRSNSVTKNSPSANCTKSPKDTPGLERNSTGLPAELVGRTIMESGQEMAHPKLGVPSGWRLQVNCLSTLAHPKLWEVTLLSAHPPFLVLGKGAVILLGLEKNLARRRATP